MGKRTLLNLILVGSVGLPASIMLGTYASFFVPPLKNKGSGATSTHYRDNSQECCFIPNVPTF